MSLYPLKLNLDMASPHSFHIPVMGIGFTIDTPLKVAHLGIDSVLSLVDDQLMERLRKVYSERFGLSYKAIGASDSDARANRITAYLNMLNRLVRTKYEEMLQEGTGSLERISAYIDLLPDNSFLKNSFAARLKNNSSLQGIRDWMEAHFSMGSIDVNIMTKVDKANFAGDVQLPAEFNDAHAALRGFALSELESTVVFSAGMSPRLYAYLAVFEDFYPNEEGFIKKKIALKVSDFRSALIQGKFLAKKGLWVSEYRVESGLNCGGHAFATDGYLLGPILEEFRDKRTDLVQEVYKIFADALSGQQRPVPTDAPALKISAQGGVGTAEEHQFLIDNYGVDSVGWGSPFLLVDEATNVDETTQVQLVNATEDDLYLSGISPLGVPFNNLRGNTKDRHKELLASKGKPGSSCPKKFLASNTEFTADPICTASRQYQHLKLKELGSLDLNSTDLLLKTNEIVEKSCICVGLGTSALLVNELDTRIEGSGVSICPGPNMAYFSRKATLKEMVDHIYGKINIISRTDRPNMFVKELNLYIDYLIRKTEEVAHQISKTTQASEKDPKIEKIQKSLQLFHQNLESGISYYRDLFGSLLSHNEANLQELHVSSLSLEEIKTISAQ